MNEKLNRKDLRIGDEVYFYNKGIRIVGTVEKVNRKSAKVYQTNDESRYSRPAFGHSGGRKMGGRGVVWTCGISNSGKTNLRYTDAYAELLRGTARMTMAQRRVRHEAEEMIGVYAREFLRLGGTHEELREAIEDILKAEPPSDEDGA